MRAHGAAYGRFELNADEIEDVILGCAMSEKEQGMNVARIASLRPDCPSKSPP
jgi:acetyl-CoA acetyltransferase